MLNINKKLAALLFAVGVGAASVAAQAQASTCTRGCINAYHACVAAGVSEDCSVELDECMLNCG
ncbi:hypothetical protein SAMN05192549_1094 [Duganella sacchari]|uniref:Uncharacterized protein n=1 Tax=Duganella sacchari TaxID=551987 RepID=A0A1M7R0J2_9BURK|nr:MULTISPECIES: hypothetical protein [Duganella]MYM32487.1 hypothetical protein [Duganella sp. CY15W]SHN37903.1 hypothetical protein SAMN05192549_1094 [Duganella sacchari]